MTNLIAIAERPLGDSYLTSSYDRSGGNIDWAVWTRGNGQGRVTLLETNGAGYISRIWIASLSAGKWLFFFDREQEPRLVLTHQELFGGRFPFVAPLAGESGGGRYSLVPIPFARHIRVDFEPDKFDPQTRNYYHINYALSDGPTPEAESWPQQLSEAESNTVTAVRAVLSRDATDLANTAAACLVNAGETALAPGETARFVDSRGRGSVNAFAIRIVTPNGADLIQAEALRSLRLRMYWDGSKAPSVDVPLGDFFCNPFFTREFAAFAVGRVGGTYVSRMPMPYRKRAVCTVENRGQAEVRLLTGAVVAKGSAETGARYFHACWSASTRTGAPFTMANVQGPGHYVGCFLTSIGQDGSWSMLEGDEFILPDQGHAPGQYGTGLEDYFSGAYYYSGLFDLPYHGLIEKGAMRTEQYRFLALDAVDFSRSLTAGIEFGDQNKAEGYMSSVVYWYGDAPRDCTLGKSQEGLLARPADRFELAGFMSQMFTLERAGLWRDAAARCDFLARKHRRYDWADTLRLRAAAYREMDEGLGAVRPEYFSLTQSRHPATSRQAGDHLWLHEADSHALLGIHMLGRYKVWVDGTEVAAGEAKAGLDVRRIEMQPGVHSWEVDFVPTSQGSFASLCLRTKWGKTTSAGDWQTLEIEPLPGRDAPKLFQGRSPLPNMTLWQFEPNGYVDMQSGAQAISIWHFWDARPTVKRVRLRQTWTNGPSATGSVVLPADATQRSREEERAHATD